MSKLTLAILSLALVACAKDKTADEYQREKAAQNKALYDSVAGDYSGVVYAKEDGAVMGTMSLALTSDQLANPPKDSDLAIGTPILAGSMTYLNESKLTLTAPLGVYDPTTGAYQADMPVNANDKMTITGTITGGALTGTLQAQRYPGSGGRFRLALNGGSVETLLERARPGWRPAPKDSTKTFTGSGKFDRDTPRTMHIEVSRPASRVEDFLDLFFPSAEKLIGVTVRFTDTVGAHFPNAHWDPLSGRVEGESPGNGYTMKLVCESFYFRAQRGSFYCIYSTTRSSPIRIDFKPPFN